MLIDGLLQFDPAGTAVTASAASTNVLDLMQARDLGIGDEPLQLMVVTNGAFAPTTASLNIQVQGAPDNGSGAPGTWTTYAESGALTGTQLNANGNGTVVLPIDLPARAPGAAVPRYLRLNYVVTSGPFTTGTLQAALVLERGQIIANFGYPPGTVVNN